MTWGIPITCSDKASIPEIVSDAALFFDPEDTDSTARAMSSISTNSRLRSDLASKGLKSSERFSLTKEALRLAEKFVALVKEPIQTKHF
jgi:glycosyltransferase involved in cell wall biosynthesis